MLLIKKKSLLEKEFVFSKDTMSEFAKLMDEKKINILSIGNMKREELVEIGEQLSLDKVKTKSLEMLRKEIGHLVKIFLAGQVQFSVLT
jgi:hypothetical protein